MELIEPKDGIFEKKKKKKKKKKVFSGRTPIKQQRIMAEVVKK